MRGMEKIATDIYTFSREADLHFTPCTRLRSREGAGPSRYAFGVRVGWIVI